MEMEEDFYLKTLPIVLKVCNGLDIRHRKISRVWLLWAGLSCLYTMSSTVYRVIVKKDHETLELQCFKDMMVIIIVLINIAVLVVKNNQMLDLVDFLMTPFEMFEPSSIYQEGSSQYYRSTYKIDLVSAVISYIMLTSFVIVFILTSNYTLSSNNGLLILFLPFGQSSCSIETCFKFGVECVSSISTVLLVGGIMCGWYITMVFAALKVKTVLKLLSFDILNLDLMLKHRVASTLVSLGVYFTGEQKIQVFEHCIRDCFRQCAQKHVNLMRCVSLMNECYSLPTLVLTQVGLLVGALTLHNMTEDLTLSASDIMYTTITVAGSVFWIGVLCYSGQGIIDESKNFYQSLSSCNCQGKPTSYRNNLMIMKMAAKEPLRLSVAGICPLSMDSYCWILQSAYSYLQVLLTIKPSHKTP